MLLARQQLARSMNILGCHSRQIHSGFKRRQDYNDPDSKDTDHSVPKVENFYDDLQYKMHGSRPYHLRKVLKVKAEGKGILNNPLYNKGTGFSNGERDRLGLRGLLPPRVITFEDQIQRILLRLKSLGDGEEADFERYKIMRDLHDRNETLFHRVLLDNISTIAPIVYTPTVGKACLKFGDAFTRSRGMYFSKDDHGEMAAMCYNWPEDDVQVIVVTDGSRILGLGDLGANGMGIPIGKLALYCAAGGVAPHRTLPVMFDMGTNNEDLLDDSLYLGMPHRRIEGEPYLNMLDEFMFAVFDRWPNVLVQFEDFSSDKAMKILQRYRRKLLCFNDDIQGTGAVSVAGILGALKQQGKPPRDLLNQKIVVAGAGSAGLGVSNALIDSMVHMGLSRKEAMSNFYVVDVNGVLSADNPQLEDEQREFARDDETAGMSLQEVIDHVQPNILLGLTAYKGLFTTSIIQAMADANERPIIFPLSNPTSQCECTAEEVYRITKGRGIFASGSPFESVDLNGQTLIPSQCNNMFIFPGVGFGATLGRCKVITDKMVYQASLALASSVTEEEMAAGRVFPNVERIRDVSVKVACAVIEQAHKEGVLRDPVIQTLLDGNKNQVLNKVTPADAIEFEAYVYRKMYDPIYVPLVDEVYHSRRDM